MHVWPQDGMSDTASRPRPKLEDYQKAAEFAGVILLDRPPAVGEMYLAGRNTGIKLLTAGVVSDRNWVEPTDGESYYYNTSECIAVQES